MLAAAPERSAPWPSRTAWLVLAWGIGLAGAYFRLEELGRWAFWNDEAWVALATRVEGFGQFWLSLAVTPVLWGATLRLVSRVFAAPEFTLRLLPFAFGCLTMWVAYRVGRALAGHELGGILALAVIAFDPHSIRYAKLLKHYTAEAFFALLAFREAERSGRRRHLVGLVAVLCVGCAFSNSQLLVAPPLLGALLVAAVLQRDRRRLPEVVAATAVVAVWDAAFYRLAMAPRLSASLDAYWQESAPRPAGLFDAVVAVVGNLRAELGVTWSAPAMAVALACLVAFVVVRRGQRATGLALALLPLELAVLALRRPVPLGEPRLMLFVLTVLSVCMAAAMAAVLVRLAARRTLAPVAAIILVALAADVAVSRDWGTLGRATDVEDTGRLVEFLATASARGDGVLVYERSVFVYAYYSPATPVLVPSPFTTVGYVPRLDDPNLVVVRSDDVVAATAQVFASRARVWFVGSRFKGDDETRIRSALGAHGHTILELRRPRALLLLVTR